MFKRNTKGNLFRPKLRIASVVVATFATADVAVTIADVGDAMFLLVLLRLWTLEAYYFIIHCTTVADLRRRVEIYRDGSVAAIGVVFVLVTVIIVIIIITTNMIVIDGNCSCSRCSRRRRSGCEQGYESMYWNSCELHVIICRQSDENRTVQ